MAKRISAFAGLPLLSSLTPFLLLPYIARVGGEGTWNALAVGQAVGSLAAILVALGWTLSGPARVAGTSDPELRRHLYAISLLTRLVAFAVCLPILAVVAALSRIWALLGDIPDGRGAGGRRTVSGLVLHSHR